MLFHNQKWLIALHFSFVFPPTAEGPVGRKLHICGDVMQSSRNTGYVTPSSLTQGERGRDVILAYCDIPCF